MSKYFRCSQLGNPQKYRGQLDCYASPSLQDKTDGIHGLLIGDKWFVKSFLKQELAEHEIDLQTPLRKNMIDTRSKSFVRQLISARRLVETVIGQLTDRFNIEMTDAGLSAFSVYLGAPARFHAGRLVFCTRKSNRLLPES